MSKPRRTQLHAGHGRGGYGGDEIWHTDSKGNYWIGNLYYRTPQELYTESLSVIADLTRNHPELVRRRLRRETECQKKK